MVQVQVRMPQEAVAEIDELVDSGRFRSRSDAIKFMVEFYEEREKTKGFLRMLVERSDEAKGKPEILVPLEEV
jgi:Arc/MetJ-type ribon-helix-helix transcriptional regulator